MPKRTNKTWVEISAGTLRANAKALRMSIGPRVLLMGVVKSNAYGHDAKIVVSTLSADVDWFGVDSLKEAENIREYGSKKPILILGYTPKEDLKHVVRGGFSQVCYTRKAVKTLSLSATKRYPAKVHIKIETGTSRQGLHVYDLPAFLRYIKGLPHVHIEGVSTHFANIEDTKDNTYAMKQLAHFNDAKSVFESLSAEPAIYHTACSAAAILHPETHFGMVRAGIALYGLWPSQETMDAANAGGRAVKLRPALTWKTMIAQVKPLKKGAPVSYGLTETVKRHSRVAVLPVGYFDGYDRHLSSSGEVLIRGKRAKVLGRVCMNMIIVDVTDIPSAKEDDEVVLIGKQGKETISAEEIAERIDTINYEVVTRINPLLPRITVK